MNLDLKKAKLIAETAALEAGDYFISKQKQVRIKKFKDKIDIQTDVDIEVEALIIDTIKRRYPGHNIQSEESGKIDNNSEYTWVIDPLDGTKEYFRGLPTYSTCISLENNQEILLGCNYVPRTDELFSACKDNGSFENKFHKLRVSKQENLSHSLVAVHPPNFKLKEPEYTKIWLAIAKLAKQTYRLRPTAFDNTTLCHLAKGGYEGYFVLFDQGPQWEDISSGIIISKEAGAKVTNRYGKTFHNWELNNGLIVSNGKIHDKLVKLLS